LKLSFFQSDLEWLDIEIVDFDLAITDFLKTKDSSIDKRTHKLIGEKITRYFNERLKARESLINKLRGRSSGFRSQIIHLDIQLKQKEEGGDTLNEIDFDELKIENKQFLDKIDEKNIELILFKRQVGKVTQLINHYKDDLTLKTKDLLHVQQHIDKQQILYEHAQQELDIVNNEQLRVAKKHHDLLEQTESYRVPEILDYVRKKALLYKLQRDCEVWQRKVELVSVSNH
jgi:hypothetical protein